MLKALQNGHSLSCAISTNDHLWPEQARVCLTKLGHRGLQTSFNDFQWTCHDSANGTAETEHKQTDNKQFQKKRPIKTKQKRGQEEERKRERTKRGRQLTS